MASGTILVLGWRRFVKPFLGAMQRKTCVGEHGLGLSIGIVVSVGGCTLGPAHAGWSPSYMLTLEMLGTKRAYKTQVCVNISFETWL